MPYCPKCGMELTREAEYCTKCGNKLNNKSENQEKPEDKKTTVFEKTIEDTAETIGKRAEAAGKRLEKSLDKAGDHFENWFDKTFLLAGPLIISFIGLIVLRIVIFIFTDIIPDSKFFTVLGNGLYSYILYIFAFIILGNYNNYFNRKYRSSYQWIFPAISAIGFIGTLYITARIFIYIDADPGLKSSLFVSLAGFIDTYLILIFIAVLLIGYGSQIAFGKYSPHNNKSN